MILRPYQDQAVDLIHDAFSAAQSVCYALPTGGGKTVVFADIARRCHEYGTRTAILVHRDTLLTQASNKLSDIGVKHSIIAPGRVNHGDNIYVASVQTLVRRLDRHEFDFLVIDEAHHAVAGSYRKIIEAWPEAHVLGVSATPCRMDGRGLGEIFQRLLLGPTIRQLIDDGYLTEAISYGASHVVNLSNARTTAGDYNTKDLQKIMDKNEITGDAVKHYSKLCPGAPAIAFCVSVQHAQDVAREFELAGYRATSVDGRMPLNTIRSRIAGLADGRVQVLASCDLISEGFDAPGVTAAILLRPTKSLGVYLQQVGRTLRPVYQKGMPLNTPGQRKDAIKKSCKPAAVILDHAGNAFRHGLADEPREWSLDARKKKPSNSLAMKSCSNCFAYCKVWEKSCRHCGHVFAVAVVPREMNHVDGELTRLDSTMMYRLRRREEANARTYEELRMLGQRRGYAPQWAYKRALERGII